MISLKRELKRAKLFEIQKITKRVRALGRRRGTEAQVEKNQRKVQRLQHDLELVKDVSVANLCSRIEAKDDDIIQLALTTEPPSDLNEKAEWRLLTSKAVRDSLKELIQKSEPVKRTINKRQFDRRGRRDERRLKVGGEEEGKDSDLDLEDITEAAAVTSSKHSKDGLGSVFVTSLSASAVGESGGRGLPRKIRKSVVKKNRLGQRSRRKVWEEKYGGKAKHLRRIVAKRKKRLEAGGTKPGAVRGTGGKTAEAEEISHPSWVAKRQMKTGIEQFQGQKIVFDSD